MPKKHSYRAEPIERFRLEPISSRLQEGCIVALDVAKQKYVVAFASPSGDVIALVRFDHPLQTGVFLELVRAVQATVPQDRLVAAMEPTGTYGDAIRHQLMEAGVRVQMVSPKRTYDSRAIFDNVSSLHDAKSAFLIARLCALGLAQDWTPPSPLRVRLRALVELRAHEEQLRERSFGRLEGLLARHWPEFGRWLDLRGQRSALKLLVEFGSPARVASDPTRARRLLMEASSFRLSAEVIDGSIAGAHSSVGEPMVDEQQRLIRVLAGAALDATKRADDIDEDLASLAHDDAAFAQLRAFMGTYSAAVLVTFCDPRQYASAGHLEKACGLNLREKSSGQHEGRISITKRGPGLVRKVLYLFALRMVQESALIRAWYRKRRGYTDDSKQRAVIAVMRKLVRAIFHIMKTGQPFDAAKLVDSRRLDATPLPAKPRIAPRAVPRGSTQRGAAATQQS